ncbi:restriction endonuclease subunit S [Levilactobacillus brevis]|uniref:restriction endonuclease subunit S n=1 Tax=Levilactobacillus brevis TaxID=1580 RepID=UPI003D76CA0A
MKDNQAKYPQLRFKGFTDPWEKRKVGELYKVTRGQVLATSKTTPEKVGKNQYPVYSSQTKNDGLMGYYSDYLFDTAITWTTDGANAGTVNFRPGKFYSTNVNGVLLSADGLANKAMAENLNRSAWRWVSHVGNPKLMNNVMSEISVMIPVNLSEQEKISEFLMMIDNTITLHQRKLAKLKELKQGYLQKLFPQNGSKFPQLRFAGFADAWEQRKLGEVATFLNGRAYKQDELLDSGKYKVLRVGNFYTNDSWYYSNMELGDKYYVDKGDLVYTWSATFGPHIWSGEKVIYHYHIWKVELSKFLDRNFTLQLLEADKARLLSSTNGSTMIHVTKGDMESKIVSIPNIDEQKQIGSFFKQLDNTITLHQRKLEKLQELKKGYLQKMFC